MDVRIFQSVRWNACVHRLDLGLYSHPKEFWGNFECVLDLCVRNDYNDLCLLQMKIIMIVHVCSVDEDGYKGDVYCG